MKINGLVACAFLLSSGSASAFSQFSPVFPIGHEAVTVLGSHNSLGYRSLPKPTLTMHQKSESAHCWTKYGATDPRLCAVVLGNRWVDIMGFNVAPGTSDFKCFQAVAQDQDKIMYDHFLRMERDLGETGRTDALNGGVATYKYLVNMAVNSLETWTSSITDGGIIREVYHDVPMSYFLLGRAMHLLQDSFSTEHATRLTKWDSQGRAISSIVVDVASYRCMSDVYQEHSHEFQSRELEKIYRAQDFLTGSHHAEHGDIIWNKGVTNVEQTQLAAMLKGDTRNVPYISTYVKRAAVDAVFATADLFDTFLSARLARVQGRKDIADKVIAAHVDRWFTRAKKGMPVTHTAADVAKCTKGGVMGPMEDQSTIGRRRDACLLQTCPDGKKRSDGTPCTNSLPNEKHKPPFSWIGKVDDIK